MKPTTTKIEKALRKTPAPSPSGDLYARLKSNLPAEDRGMARPPLRNWLIAHPAIVAFIALLTVSALGSGFYVVNQIRWRNSEEVPTHRLRDVVEPVQYYAEDIQPLSEEFLEFLHDLSRQAKSHQETTGKQTRWFLLDVQLDGTVAMWTAHDTDRFFLSKTNWSFHANQHPNDYRNSWEFNPDGSPMTIVEVKPHHEEQWKFGQLTDGGMSFSDGFNDKSGYLVKLEKPKTDRFFRKVNMFEFNWARFSGETWNAVIKNIQFGGPSAAESLFFALRLPSSAEQIETSPVFAASETDKQGRPIFFFAEEAEGNGRVPSLEITYRLPPSLGH